MYNDNYNDINNDKRYNNNTVDPYNRNNRDYENNNYNSRYEPNNSLNKTENYNSPLKTSYSLMDKPSKTKRFQNENLVVYRVSPFHAQYRYRIYDDMNYKNNNYTRDKVNGDQSYNVEREKMYNQYNNEQKYNKNLNIPPQYEGRTPQNFRNSQNPDNFRNNNNNYNNNYDNNNDNRNIKYRTPNNNSYIRNNNTSRTQQIEENYINGNSNRYNNNFYKNENNYTKNDNYNSENNYRRNYDNYNMERINDNRENIRRNNSDFEYINNNRNIEKEKELRQYYLKNPIDYYHGEEIDDGFRHYSPLSNDFNGSRFGDYTYNYYLNAPMRGDKSEDWRFPPLYYYKPNYDPKRKIYTNYH